MFASFAAKVAHKVFFNLFLNTSNNPMAVEFLVIHSGRLQKE